MKTQSFSLLEKLKIQPYMLKYDFDKHAEKFFYANDLFEAARFTSNDTQIVYELTVLKCFPDESIKFPESYKKFELIHRHFVNINEERLQASSLRI